MAAIEKRVLVARKNKFQYDGKVMCGDVLAFIRKREAV